MKPKCAGCGGKVKRPVHPSARLGFIFCSSACRKGTQRAHVTAVTNAQLGIGTAAQFAGQAMDGLGAQLGIGMDLASGSDETVGVFIEPKEEMHKPQAQSFPLGVDKPGLLDAFESRVRAGDEAAPKIYNALAQSLNPGVEPHEWAFNRNQEVYQCAKCSAQIDLRLIQHFSGPADELFKGRCRGIPSVEMKTAVVAVAEKAEAEFVGHDPMEDLQHGEGHEWAFDSRRCIYQCGKCKAWYRENARQSSVDEALKSHCPIGYSLTVPERPGRVINFDEEV